MLMALSFHGQFAKPRLHFVQCLAATAKALSLDSQSMQHRQVKVRQWKILVRDFLRPGFLAA